MDPNTAMGQQLPSEALDLIESLSRELASELDLHYDEEDYFALEPSITPLRHAENLLEQNGRDVPEVVSHVLRLYRRNFN